MFLIRRRSTEADCIEPLIIGRNAEFAVDFEPPSPLSAAPAIFAVGPHVGPSSCNVEGVARYCMVSNQDVVPASGRSNRRFGNSGVPAPFLGCALTGTTRWTTSQVERLEQAEKTTGTCRSAGGHGPPIGAKGLERRGAAARGRYWHEQGLGANGRGCDP